MSICQGEYTPILFLNNQRDPLYSGLFGILYIQLMKNRKKNWRELSVILYFIVRLWKTSERPTNPCPQTAYTFLEYYVQFNF